MKQVRVIAADGAVVRGPARVQITMPQMLRWPSVLGNRWRRGGVFDVPEGRELAFDAGEVFGIADPGGLDREAVEPSGWRWDDVAPVEPVPVAQAVEAEAPPAAKPAARKAKG